MATVYLGSLMLVPYNFAPRGFQPCSGQLLSVSQNTALFSLLGTQFGGDGRSNFGLPNLEGSIAIGKGQGPGLELYDMGESAGEPTATLTGSTVPHHNHSVLGGKQAADANAPKGNVLAVSSNPQVYSNAGVPLAPMNGQSTNIVGGNQPHNNMMPYQGLQWIIALQGVFPPRS
jgi:microcystin-dependent protein